MGGNVKRDACLRHERLLSATFDVELGDGTGERSVNGSNFLVRELVAETGFSALTGFFDFGLVNAFSWNRHVGQDGNVIAGNFDEAFAGGEGVFVGILADDDFAGDHLGHERDVQRVNAELTFDAGESDHFDLLGVGGPVGGYDFQF
jgi:hypothetical protein